MQIESILDPHGHNTGYFTRFKPAHLVRIASRSKEKANQSTRPGPARLIPRYSITGECTSPCYWWHHFKIQTKQYNTIFQIYHAYSVQNILWTQHMKLRKQEGNTTPSVLILLSIQACFSAQVLQKSRIQQDERKLKTTQVTGGQGTVQKIELLPHVWYITSLQGQKELVGGWNVWHFFFLLHPTCQLTVYHED